MSTHTQPAAPSRLAAALAYRPTTAPCHACGRRFMFANMDYCNRFCRRCWARMCRQYRQVHGIKQQALDAQLDRLWDWLGDNLKDAQQAEFWRLWDDGPQLALDYLQGMADQLRKQRKTAKKRRRAA